MTVRWSFVGYPLRDDLPADWPEGIPIKEEPDGGYVYRVRPGPVPRCKCGGLKSQHGKDRRGRPTCFCTSVCACSTYRPDALTESMDRHPSGNAPTDKEDQ